VISTKDTVIIFRAPKTQYVPFSLALLGLKSYPRRVVDSGAHRELIVRKRPSLLVFRRLKSCAVSGILTSEYVAEEEKKAVYLPKVAKKKTTSKTYTQNGEA